MTDLPKVSEAKSKAAISRPRVGGRFVSTNPSAKEKKEKLVKEEAYQITEEDRAQFGSDSKAFFEWALTKAATRYEASKYAKELMRFQYPSLSSVEVQQEVEVVEHKVKWIYADASEVITSQATDIPLITDENKDSVEDPVI